MGTKQVHFYNMAFTMLCECTAEADRPVTAGEYAKYMGCSRSTAVRWLAFMSDNGAVRAVNWLAANHIRGTRYEPRVYDGTVSRVGRADRRESHTPGDYQILEGNPR